MALALWGAALVGLGLAVTFSSLLGFVPGLPLLGLGLVLLALAVAGWVLGLPVRAARAVLRR